MSERVQKLIAQAGVTSRRKAEELITKRQVKINGRIATLGDKATFSDEITVKGKPIFKEQKIYLLMNKPSKTVTTLNDPEGRRIITDLVNVSQRVFPIGRLDYNTTGTIILTNDGELANNLSHPSREIIRVYRARLEEKLTSDELEFLNSDKVKLDDYPSKQKVTQVDNKSYVIALTQGKYHHVKRLFELVGKRVQSLTRIEFAGLTHIGLKTGQYRNLKAQEVKQLKSLKNN